jgi:hypothetical protein
MAPRIRNNVWKLSVGTDAKATNDPWHPTLHAYERAVAAMLLRPSGATDSWWFLANTHRTYDPPPANALWNACEHRRMYFLAWHRAYLVWFERAIQRTIGDDSWALPYWSYEDPAQPTWMQLPPEFRVPRHRVNGSLVDNALYVQLRAPDVNTPNPMTGAGVLKPARVSVVNAMARTQFVRRSPDVGFGGQLPPGMVFGAVESLPHNNVHVDVGGQTGLMWDPATAARDPIFWLHHANIDRLWEVWRTMPWAVPIETDPAVPPAARNAYMATDYVFGYSTAPSRYAAADVVNTTSAQLDYVYDSIALPNALRQAVDAARAQAVPGGPMGLDDLEPPEWFAHAESADLSIPKDGGSFSIGEDGGVLGLEEDLPGGLLLQFNGVRTASPAPGYRVKIAASADGVEHDAGELTTFGLGQALDEGGFDYSVDATALVPKLVEDGWRGGPLQIRVEPEEAAGWRTEAGLTIASVKVFLR